ncbi:MAG: ABC transporter permease subunit [Actinomycetota bacterium]|nr:ABC transporter permease subunit [Actinomycetota bacterium]
MLGSVFTKALKDRRLSIAGWTAGAVVLTQFVVAVYSTIANSAEMLDFIDQIPEDMLSLFGVDPATFLTGAGYLQVQLYSLMSPILIIGLGITAAASATAAEEQSGTMDMQLSMPINRTNVLLQKTAMVLVSLTAVALAIAVTLIATNPIFELKLSIEGIAAANIGLLGLGMVFAATALVIGAYTGTTSTALGLTLLLSVLGWFVNAFSAIFGWLEIPSRFSPFSWYLGGNPLLNGGTSGLVWLGLTTAALVGIAAFLFNRRDLSTETNLVPQIRSRWRSTEKKRAVTSPRAVWLLRSIAEKSLWDRRRSVFGWAGGLAALLLATFAAWPALSSDPDALAGLVDAVPRELLALTGISDPEYLASAAGFVSSRTYQSIGPVVVIVFAIGAVSSLIVKEERRGVLDLVLSNPLSRRTALVGKAVAIALLTAVIAGVLSLVGLVSNIIWSTDIEVVNILTANVGLALLGLFFGGLALGLWSLFPSSGSAVGVTTGVALAGYLLNGVGSLVDGLSPFRKLSPFYWYLGDVPPLAHGLSVGYLLLGAGVLLFSVLAIWRFDSRDLAV